jgi:sugar/nucleoside kinase (ribokinase family)
MQRAEENLLLGPASLDIHLEPRSDGRRVEVAVYPGGGALNMAYHWAALEVPFTLLTRIGDDRPAVFLDFLRRHGIAGVDGSIVAPGVSASIDITTQPDRQPWMDNFVEGVWTGFTLTPEESRLVIGARRLHAVLVDAVVEELHRLGDAGALAQLDVSADFLSLRHYDLERFAATMRHVGLGFVGWPGEPDDPTVRGIATVTADLHRLVVVTLGSRGVLLLDGRGSSLTERMVPVHAVDVIGTTVGCGDSFIAAFLAVWWRGGDLDAAVAAGAAAGAAATSWMLPLPDDAY